MIQRIQTVYLLLASCLVALSAVFPLFSFQLAETSEMLMGQETRLYAFSWKALGPDGVWSSLATLYYLGIAFCSIALFSFSVIFFYKNRKKQIKMTKYAFILKIALLATVGYYVYLAQTNDVVATKPQIGVLLFAISMVFDWLAVKAIRKDEDLVRSVDRIR
ncbi:MAG: DUF4293 domain-containing protein [Bacteroidales bacterium]|nr:DUF4293 domain-containing protein [Bacteroidales bacterium]